MAWKPMAPADRRPLLRLTGKGEVEAIAAQRGAVAYAHRIIMGAWVGRDFFAADGRMVLQSMSACGNPK